MFLFDSTFMVVKIKHPYTIDDAVKFIELAQKEVPQTIFAVTFT
jgi:hypothetical protein